MCSHFLTPSARASAGEDTPAHPADFGIVPKRGGSIGGFP